MSDVQRPPGRPKGVAAPEGGSDRRERGGSVPRPDPDALIEKIRDDEAKAARGKLRVYFGASAGVGKTYAMLAAARQAKAAGRDVVAGVVETHARAETEAQLEGLEVLPRRPVVAASAAKPVETVKATEFDLDAALARRPGLLLVDELAHSNAAGSRHPKRWQDVDELLGAGIDVWTTLNVQHLESLNDVVGGITGIRVRETLPDTFFDRADEIVLVDTPADELLARLKAGKVYAAAAAERAAANFFRKGHLIALRELALRRTADRVEDDVQTWRAESAVGRVWKTEGGILCCIGPGEDGAGHVIRGAALLAQGLAVSWHAVYVETPALQRLPDERRARILGQVALAETLGARTAVLPGDGVAGTVLAHAREHNLSRIVMGHNAASRFRPAGTLAQQLGRAAGDVDLIELGVPAGAAAARPAGGPAGGRGGTATPATLAAGTEAEDAAPPWRRPWSGYAVAVLACAALAAVCWPIEGLLDDTNIVMLFLLAGMGVALAYGRGPAVLSAVVNVVVFDFFFVPPKFSFDVDDLQYVVTFIVMLTVGLVVGQLTAGLRFQARVAGHRERRSHALFELARDLSSRLATEQVVETTREAVAGEFHARVAVFVLDAADRLVLADDVAADVAAAAAAAAPKAAAAAGPDPGTARWAFDQGRAAGLGTDTLPGSGWLYLPLKAPMRIRGVLAVRPETPRLLAVPEQRRQLETVAALAAIALERVHYVEVAGTATLQIESERLRNSLLSALSHDLRTPLAGLVGLAESLQLTGPKLTPEQDEIAVELQAEALRMSTQVHNLLDMARIESGGVRLRPAWNSVEEMVGGAARLTRRVRGERSLSTDLPPDLPLVRCDAVLIERVLVNLLENASRYTPPAARIEISARALGGAPKKTMRIAVADDGPGIRPGQEREIFEKFSRGVRESATAGVGLGLAICRSIVEAHGGMIEAGRRDGGGAVFAFTLPLGEAPGLEPDGGEATEPAGRAETAP